MTRPFCLQQAASRQSSISKTACGDVLVASVGLCAKIPSLDEGVTEALTPPQAVQSLFILLAMAFVWSVHIPPVLRALGAGLLASVIPTYAVTQPALLLHVIMYAIPCSQATGTP